MDDERHQEIARCLFRESNDALFIFDPRDHRVLDLNPVSQRLTGYGKSEATTLRLWQLFSSTGEPSLTVLIEAYQRTGFFHSREGFFLTPSAGKPIPVNVSVSRIHTRPEPLGLVVARDITERLRVQEELHESERRFRGLVDSANVLILTLSAAGTITSVNPVFESLTDWSRDEWLNRPVIDLLHPDDRDRARAHIDQALREGSTALDTFRLEAKYAGYRDIEVLSLSRVVQGRTIGVSLIARDVTEAKRAAEALRRTDALRRAEELAETAARAQRDFVAQISHEIRTPVASILGYADLLREHPYTRQAPPDYLDGFAVIRRNGLHLLDLLNDLLDLGQLHVEPVLCAPGAVLADVVRALEPTARAAGIALIVEAIALPPAPIRTDPARLRQILTNLVANAIKSTGEGGTVRVRVTLEPGATETSQLQFNVIDSGVGLDPRELARIFEPFQRSMPVRGRREMPGSGLGLAIARSLAERLGGGLTATSQPGQGSTFTLTLPAVPAEVPGQAPIETSPPGNAVPPPDLSGLRLLVVEDDEANRRIIALRLRRCGAEVTEASDGQIALDAVLSASASGPSFDLALIDLQMPQLDGIEFARQLRALGTGPPLVALTASATVDDRADCLRAGFVDFVSKPFQWDQLAAVIAAHARRPSPTTPPATSSEPLPL